MDDWDFIAFCPSFRGWLFKKPCSTDSPATFFYEGSRDWETKWPCEGGVER